MIETFLFAMVLIGYCAFIRSLRGSLSNITRYILPFTFRSFQSVIFLTFFLIPLAGALTCWFSLRTIWRAVEEMSITVKAAHR